MNAAAVVVAAASVYLRSVRFVFVLLFVGQRYWLPLVVRGFDDIRFRLFAVQQIDSVVLLLTERPFCC